MCTIENAITTVVTEFINKCNSKWNHFKEMALVAIPASQSGSLGSQSFPAEKFSNSQHVLYVGFNGYR